MATQATLSREIALAHGQQLVGEIRALLAKAKAERSGSIDLGGAGSGEHEGHPFRGNQWTGEGGSSKITESDPTGSRTELDVATRAFIKKGMGIESSGDHHLQMALNSERIAMKKTIVTDTVPHVVAHTDLSEKAATKLMTDVVDQWAESSGDSLATAVKVQQMAIAEFGLQDVATEHFTVKGWHKYPDDHLRAALRAQYENTQKFFKEQGITHLTVARGTTEGDPVVSEGEPLNVRLQPLSSWSTSLATARAFTVFNDRAKMLVTRVPVERVLSTCVTGNGCLTEAEVVVLGGPVKTTAYAMSGRPREDLLKVTKALR